MLNLFMCLFVYVHKLDTVIRYLVLLTESLTDFRSFENNEGTSTQLGDEVVHYNYPKDHTLIQSHIDTGW